MYIVNIARAVKRSLSVKSETLSLKNIIKELDFLRKTVIIQSNDWKIKFIVACKQINRKNTISAQS